MLKKQCSHPLLNIILLQDQKKNELEASNIEAPKKETVVANVIDGTIFYTEIDSPIQSYVAEVAKKSELATINETAPINQQSAETAVLSPENDQQMDDSFIDIQTAEIETPEAQSIEDIQDIEPAAPFEEKLFIEEFKQAPVLQDIQVKTIEKPASQIRLWEAKRGKDLDDVLKKWSEIEQATLIWDTTENYELNKDIFISGTFENALDILFTKGLRSAPDHELTFTPEYTLRVYK